MIIFKLAHILLEKGISNKTDFAKEIGMNRWGLTKLVLRQPERVDLMTIEKLCRGLKCTPYDLFELVDDSDEERIKELLEGQQNATQILTREAKLEVATERKGSKVLISALEKITESRLKKEEMVDLARKALEEYRVFDNAKS